MSVARITEPSGQVWVAGGGGGGGGDHEPAPEAAADSGELKLWIRLNSSECDL